MKPVRFKYHAPESLEEALLLLQQLAGEEVKVLAGGQSLMPMLNMRLVRPWHLVDINRVCELNRLMVEDGTISIGALTRHRTVESSAPIREAVPLLAEAAPLVGDRLIRYRGTLGGSLVHADPSAEFPTVAVALDAQIVLGRTGGSRIVPASEFFVTFLTTAIAEDELLLEVRFPRQEPGAGWAFEEFARQHGDFAVVSAAAVVTLMDDGISNARLALGGVAPTPIRARAAEAYLLGRHLDDGVLAAAGRLAADEAEPTSDVHGSADYRREVVAVYAQRALQSAAARAHHESARGGR